MDKDTDELRRDAGKYLENLIETYGFSPRLICAHIPKLHYRSIYRWIGSPGFLVPPLKVCGKIFDFVKVVELVRRDFQDVVASWNSQRYSKPTTIGLYSLPYLNILESDMTLDEKVRRLTLLVFKQWAKAKT